MATATFTIPVEQVKQSRIGTVDFKNLEFGHHLADHMFVADFEKGAWTRPRIVPFADITVSPAVLALHYGQSVFEGMKAFRTASGEINIFRPQKHLARLNQSLDRMCMPPVPEELFLSALETLVDVDSDWVPDAA